MDATGTEQRKDERLPFDGHIEYSLSVLDVKKLRRVDSTGQGINASKQGIGFFTDFPLEPGHVIAIKRKGDAPCVALIRWVRQMSSGYRVGASFP